MPTAPNQNGAANRPVVNGRAAFPDCIRYPVMTAISPSDAADSTVASRCKVASGEPRRAAWSVTAAEPLDNADAMNTPPSNLLFAHSGTLVAPNKTPL